MNKKYLVSLVMGGLFITASVFATTDCGSQAEPAFGCRAGYSVMCLSAGGDHWGCGKESNGIVIEVSGSPSGSLGTTSVETTTRTQTNVENKDTSSDDSRLLPTVNKIDEGVKGDANSERVLPTVNKKTDATVTVPGWDADKKESIQSDIDTEIENDSAIKSVEVSEDAVAMAYATPAKLFGFIPMNMNLSISADAEGRVKVRFPWFSFLVKSDFNKTAEVLNGIFQHNQSDFEFVNAKGSAKAQVEIFTTLSKAMHEMTKSIIQNIKA